MSLFGMMRTGVSGMNAQANALGTVSDNISNSDTTGYKRATAEFSTLLQGTNTNSYTSGGVNTDVRYGVSDQGNMQGTTSPTDLAINGNGFFVVNSSSGTPYLTRAGSFVPDSSGNLVNAAGFFLMGYNLTNGGSTGVANGLTGLQKVNVAQSALRATASTAGSFSANLPSGSTAVPAGDPTLPSNNTAGAKFTDKTSMVTYDNLGNPVTLDVYFTNTSPAAGPPTWEVSVFNHADANATSGGFPYTVPAGGAEPLSVASLAFDPATGALASTTQSVGGTAPVNGINVAIPNGQNFSLDFSKVTQLGTGFTSINAQANGNAPSPLTGVDIANDGTLFSIYQNGTRIPSYKIPLATVASPDNLTPQSGNVYSPSVTSGEVTVGTAGAGGLGAIDSKSLEQSTVDLATELTKMVEAQRAYSANSKVFQTGAELMNVIVNLQVQ
ncbi:flagellar hook protein FlgE [Rhizobiales bacterium GAS191]|jgi:flagellar hook protein FlgE|nr:flagellar hook protein FlgE [Rhizobiales bacterium GAS113]SEC17940.1 flagellar hook protein FlgE [Rhizobiales bacterium GAS191]SED03719.1 flagellar hook protein FlgE [Rhizobiales bacterium GAS188]